MGTDYAPLLAISFYDNYGYCEANNFHMGKMFKNTVRYIDDN